jgi:4-hydroxy-tetrahydrodipicolinate synthase
VFPDTALAICRAAQAGDAARSRRLNARLEPVWRLFRDFTGLRLAYAAANQLGLTNAQPPRPILALSQEAQARVAKVIEELELA